MVVPFDMNELTALKEIQRLNAHINKLDAENERLRAVVRQLIVVAERRGDGSLPIISVAREVAGKEG